MRWTRRVYSRFINKCQIRTWWCSVQLSFKPTELYSKFSWRWKSVRLNSVSWWCSRLKQVSIWWNDADTRHRAELQSKRTSSLTKCWWSQEKLFTAFIKSFINCEYRLLRSVCVLRPCADLDYSRQAVWKHLMWGFWLLLGNNWTLIYNSSRALSSWSCRIFCALFGLKVLLAHKQWTVWTLYSCKLSNRVQFDFS